MNVSLRVKTKTYPNFAVRLAESSNHSFLQSNESHFYISKYVITECTAFNWSCKHMKKVRTSQAVILLRN